MSTDNTLTFELESTPDVVADGASSARGESALKPSRSANLADVSTALAVPVTAPATSGIFRKGVLSLFDQGVVSATNFLTMLLIGRATADEAVPGQSAHELGLYQLGLTIVLLTICVQNALISTPYAVFRNRLDLAGRRAYAASALSHLLLFAAAVTIALLVAGGVVAAGVGPIDIDPILWMLAPMVPFILLREFVRRLTFAHLQVIPALALDVSVAVLQIGGLGALALTGNLSAVTAYAMVGVACGLAAVVALVKLRDEFSWRYSKPLSDLRGNWSFGKWAFGGQVAFLFMVYSVSWMLAFMSSPDATGRYAACMSLVMAANPVLIGLDNFLSPQAIHVYNAEGFAAMRRLTLRAALLITAIVLPLVIVLMVVGADLLQFLYGYGLGGNQSVIGIGALNMLLYGFSSSSENALVALNRPAEIFWANLAGLVVTIVTGCLLIASQGVVGGAIAALAGLLVATVLKGRVFIQSEKLPTALSST